MTFPSYREDTFILKKVVYFQECVGNSVDSCFKGRVRRLVVPDFFASLLELFLRDFGGSSGASGSRRCRAHVLLWESSRTTFLRKTGQSGEGGGQTFFAHGRLIQPTLWIPVHLVAEIFTCPTFSCFDSLLEVFSALPIQ